MINNKREKALGHNIKRRGKEQACARGVGNGFTDSVDGAARVGVAQPWAEEVPDGQFFPQD